MDEQLICKHLEQLYGSRITGYERCGNLFIYVDLYVDSLEIKKIAGKREMWLSLREIRENQLDKEFLFVKDNLQYGFRVIQTQLSKAFYYYHVTKVKMVLRANTIVFYHPCGSLTMM